MSLSYPLMVSGQSALAPDILGLARLLEPRQRPPKDAKAHQSTAIDVSCLLSLTPEA